MSEGRTDDPTLPVTRALWEGLRREVAASRGTSARTVNTVSRSDAYRRYRGARLELQREWALHRSGWPIVSRVQAREAAAAAMAGDLILLSQSLPWPGETMDGNGFPVLG
jgi:hypothetical protein